tara:strand:- start:72 stop:386 length:315 start_codon:yes stop_codon:yes gene_type:complete
MATNFRIGEQSDIKDLKLQIESLENRCARIEEMLSRIEQKISQKNESQIRNFDSDFGLGISRAMEYYARKSEMLSRMTMFMSSLAFIAVFALMFVKFFDQNLLE